MNRRQSVYRSFNFQEVMPVPYHICYESVIAERLAQHYSDPNWERRFNNHVLRVQVEWESRSYLCHDRYKDLHGTVWQEGKPPYIVIPALTKPELNGYSIPSYIQYLTNPSSARNSIKDGIIVSVTFQEALKRIDTERREVFTVVDYGCGMFQRACSIFGWENFFSYLMLEPRAATYSAPANRS